MKKSTSKVIWIILAICCAILLYPREMTFAPEVELTVFYDNGEIAKNIVVRRSWTSYAGDSWEDDYATTNESGEVKFERVQKRVPIIWERIKYYLPLISMHENHSTVGSFTARDSHNHYVYGRVDYKDENCCPSKIVMTKQNFELTDSFFNF